MSRRDRSRRPALTSAALLVLRGDEWARPLTLLMQDQLAPVTHVTHTDGISHLSAGAARGR